MSRVIGQRYSSGIPSENKFKKIFATYMGESGNQHVQVKTKLRKTVKSEFTNSYHGLYRNVESLSKFTDKFNLAKKSITRKEKNHL